MSTHKHWSCARPFKSVALIAITSSVIVGCSDQAARFSDPLFGSGNRQPQFVNQSNFVQLDRAAPLVTPVKPNAPQRLDTRSTQFGQSAEFSARNITRNALPRRGLSSVKVPRDLSENTQLNTRNSEFHNFPARPTLTQPIGRQSLPPQPSISSQALPPLQPTSQSSILQSTPGISDGLSADRTLAIKDRGESEPLLAKERVEAGSRSRQFVATQRPSQEFGQSTPPALQNQKPFSVGTEWTRNYSPVPTENPAPKTSIPAEGPRAYTPPQGVYTADVDFTSTDSITQFAEPQIVRSSVVNSPIAQIIRSRSIAVDPQTTATVARRRERTHNGWTNAGGTIIHLQAGETLYSLSRRYGVPVEAIKQVNNIVDVNAVQAGQRVLIPSYVYAPTGGISAPDANHHSANLQQNEQKPVEFRTNVDPIITSASSSTQKVPRTVEALSQHPELSPKVTASSNGDFSAHRVQPGDTLIKISRLYGASIASIKAANGLGNSEVIKIGEVLSIPRLPVKAQGVKNFNNGQTDQRSNSSSAQLVDAPIKTHKNADNFTLPRLTPQRQTATAPVAASPERFGSPRPNPTRRAAKNAVPEKSAKLLNLPRIEPQTTQSTNAVRPVEASLSDGFDWPLRGDIIQKFGGNNAGINIAVPEGTAVRASAAGDVIYAGNGLADYGNLVLIRHPNGFVTAYAHNRSVLVSRGQKVRQGEVVARSGRSGSVTSPQLHFEVRDGKTPVNPMAHLSS